ncbi:tryptophan synthase subunit alpha [Micromonospora sp. NBC_01813]|uniref:tryptophan synthase subunit alpha n=1 Tax=Micromonospora sp. NBC_01813 TaxID=2975988 RepID=UPI002DD7E24D|nr:tryptophan synthase subunit alpha [Micromonospora sp. NBC_01813]WSA11283.1 tryptophan synthase subunit alpha [Micromonospora sp. NBC_01813]
MTLETRLRRRRAAGHKLLMPYVTGGVTAGWLDHLRAFADAGADAIEVGLPFSDPTVDGATIQEATHRALARGATTRSVLADLADLAGAAADVPLVASTYYNLVVHAGPQRFCAALRDAGVSGLIVPDLPLDEADELADAAAVASVDLVLLAAPTTPPPRLAQIAQRSRGFVYAVSVMGTTGERTTVADSAEALANRLRDATDRPVLVGFGISTAQHAVHAARSADGVVVGAALMRQVLDGASPYDVGGYLARMRRALDQAAHPTD